MKQYETDSGDDFSDREDEDIVPVTVSEQFRNSSKILRILHFISRSNFRIPHHDCVTLIACSLSPAVRSIMIKVGKI